ncbi:hypothetical protein Verru16b_03471 [Lacunisphaera limnophila]|uniref:NIPSNAP domain-containing protein n=1 Tax=Lacunisphaera limnophila TaxID=1838286 RepID=A0A1D8AZS3_9BACT|nr:NIPSNAP family protein [Lacunisphaera limnophila]AOS46367.1 hypothetical protein Verru16b_03471 [Lacunisphaera limnophila]
MKSLFSLLLMCSFLTVPGVAGTDAPAPVYELRIYTVLPGKMPDMLARFRDHTCALFEKHGMVNIGYWLPVKAEDQNKLYYVVKHASRDAAKASWTGFVNDPDWIKARDASEAAGKIVAGIESTYLAETDYSPGVPALTGAHVYELRTYVCNEGKLATLDARFRDHTLKLFAKHGMTNLPYWHPTDADKGAGKTLVYLLAHQSVDAAKASFDGFRQDPDWVKARTASEQAGPILVSPPASVFLAPVDFSKLQ